MIRVLLVRPQIRSRWIRLSLPPLGVMYLASYLRKYHAGDVETRILDFSIEGNCARALERALAGFEPDLIGLSAMTPEEPDLAHFARLFRRRFPRALLVAGGPHANAAPERVLEHCGVDLAVLGEGERTLLALVERLADKRSPEDLPGLALRREGRTVRNRPVDVIEDVDAIPYPAWDRVPLLDYCSWRVVNPSMSRHHKRFTTLFTSRSCPFGCAYCHNIFGKKYRPRSPENIYGEMRELEARYGIREFHICDDCFNLRPARVMELCDRIVRDRRDYRMAFVSGLRGDILTEEVIRKLRAAGTYQISVGIETASERLQKRIGRNGDLGKLLPLIDCIRREGIITHGFFMFGFPTETREEMEGTVRMALTANLVTAAFHTVAPYPGTPLFDLVKERSGGREVPMDEMFFKSSRFNLSEVPTEEMHRIIQEGFRRFYWNRKRLWDIFRLAPRKIDVLMSVVFHFLLDPRLSRLKERLTGRKSY